MHSDQEKECKDKEDKEDKEEKEEKDISSSIKLRRSHSLKSPGSMLNWVN